MIRHSLARLITRTGWIPISAILLTYACFAYVVVGLSFVLIPGNLFDQRKGFILTLIFCAVTFPFSALLWALMWLGLLPPKISDWAHYTAPLLNALMLGLLALWAKKRIVSAGPRNPP